MKSFFILLTFFLSFSWNFIALPAIRYHSLTQMYEALLLLLSSARRPQLRCAHDILLCDTFPSQTNGVTRVERNLSVKMGTNENHQEHYWVTSVGHQDNNICINALLHHHLLSSFIKTTFHHKIDIKSLNV